MANALKALVVSLTGLVLATPLAAQTVQERAGELKVWREQCSHPDPDLRLAYLEAAIETDDASIERICVRIALQSDNADVRNLGLRAAIASTNQLTFDVTMPPPLKAELERAQDNQDRLNEISGWRIMQDYRTIQTGLVFAIRDASVNEGQSNWYPFGGNSTARDNYKGKATIVGGEIRWRGNMRLSRDWACNVDVELNNAATLDGVVQCADMWPMPISAPLL